MSIIFCFSPDLGFVFLLGKLSCDDVGLPGVWLVRFWYFWFCFESSRNCLLLAALVGISGVWVGVGLPTLIWQVVDGFGFGSTEFSAGVGGGVFLGSNVNFACLSFTRGLVSGVSTSLIWGLVGMGWGFLGV